MAKLRRYQKMGPARKSKKKPIRSRFCQFSVKWTSKSVNIKINFLLFLSYRTPDSETSTEAIFERIDVFQREEFLRGIVNITHTDHITEEEGLLRLQDIVAKRPRPHFISFSMLIFILL